jgi:ubiquinone biosynthesis protein
MWIGKDLISGLRIVPKHLKWFLKETSRNNYSVEVRIREIDQLSKGINRSFYTLSLAILAAVFIACGTLFVKNAQTIGFDDIPMISWIFWGAASYLMIRIALLRKF